MDLPIAQNVVPPWRGARGPIVQLPTLGGSLPLAHDRAAAARADVIVPIANHDNNQHAPTRTSGCRTCGTASRLMAALLAMD